MKQPNEISELYILDIYAKSQQVIFRYIQMFWYLIKYLLIKDISDHWLKIKCDEHNQ